jgi:hypothetical protein
VSFDGGYTRQYRRIWSHPAFRTKQEAAVFSWLKDAAQWRDTCLQTRFGPVKLRRGEVLIAERELSEDFGLARNTLRALLERMVGMGMVTLVRDGRAPQRAGTVLQVCNYDTYQLGAEAASLGTANGADYGPQEDRLVDRGRTANDSAKPQQDQVVEGSVSTLRDRTETAERTANGPHEDHTRTKNKEENQGKEGNQASSLRSLAFAEQGLAGVVQIAAATVARPQPGTDLFGSGPKGATRSEPRAHRLPDDWRPDADDVAYARDQGLDPARVADDFCDYWHAKGGAEARKTNWSLTWKTWCRRAAERAASRRGPAPVRPREVPHEVAGRIVADVVEYCYGVVNIDYDGHWKNREFSLLIADALAAGKLPEREIKTVMQQAARRQDRLDLNPNWFRAAFGLKRLETRPDLRVVA